MLFWIGYKFYKKKSFLEIVEKFSVTSAITLLYFQPQVINASAGMLNCFQIEDEYYITDYPIEQCSNNARYQAWRNILIFPGIFVFLLVLPALAFYYIRKNKEAIFHQDVIYKIGFLLNGYSPEAYYWYFFFLRFFLN